MKIVISVSAELNDPLLQKAKAKVKAWEEQKEEESKINPKDAKETQLEIDELENVIASYKIARHKLVSIVGEP